MTNLESLVRPNILAMTPYSSARDEFTGKAEVYLDANENPYGDYNRYPDPYQQELKTLLAAQKGVKTSQLFLGNGSDQVIDLLFRVFCEPGVDKAVAFTPSYGMYEVSAQINNTALVKIPLKEDFSADLKQTLKQITTKDCKLLFVCNPNNPTGHLISKEELLWLAKNTNGILVVDEAYIDFSEAQSATTLLETIPNLVVMQTLSKSWGLANLRIGLAMASNQIIALLNKVKPPYNISGVNQQVALKALENKVLYEQQIQEILREKQNLAQQLQQMPCVLKVFASQTNFILVKVTNANAIYQNLVAKNLIVRNRSAVLENCLRITVGSPEENRQLIQSLKEQK